MWISHELIDDTGNTACNCIVYGLEKDMQGL